MTDYYTQFSYGVKVLEPEAEWADAYLRRLDVLTRNGIKLTPAEKKDACASSIFDDGFVGFEWKIEREGDDEYDTLWLTAEDHGSVEHAAAFLLQFLKKWRPKGFMFLTWAATCSKMDPDAFGGGAVAITATALRFESSFNWCDQQRERFLKRHLVEVQ